MKKQKVLPPGGIEPGGLRLIRENPLSHLRILLQIAQTLCFTSGIDVFKGANYDFDGSTANGAQFFSAPESPTGIERKINFQFHLEIMQFGFSTFESVNFIFHILILSIFGENDQMAQWRFR